MCILVEKKFLSEGLNEKFVQLVEITYPFLITDYFTDYCSVVIENNTFMNFTPEIWNLGLKDAMMR